MKNKEWKEILKKCFGKEKDDRYHAIAMLAIYGIFILILIILIRVGGNSSTQLHENSPSTSSLTPTATSSPPPSDISEEDPSSSIGENDINYSYSYTVSYNGISEVYLGKRIDDKEKFTLVKDGITTDYAILNDNYLILENDAYHITENPSRFFKYCDIEDILVLVENEIPTENNGIIKYTVSNKSLASTYKDDLSIDNEQLNSIQLYTSGEVLKSVDLDFSNYFSSIQGTSVTLTIHMEFADIGTTEEFEINLS